MKNRTLYERFIFAFRDPIYDKLKYSSIVTIKIINFSLHIYFKKIYNANKIKIIYPSEQKNLL